MTTHSQGRRILLRELPKNAVTKRFGVIHLPDRAEDDQQSQVGIVEALGPDVTTPIKKGDRVIYRQFHGTELLKKLTTLDEDLRSIWEEDILLLLEKDNEGKWKVTALNDNVTLETENVGRAGLIFIPKPFQKRALFGCVKHVGELVPDLVPGDRVVFSKFGGADIAIGEEHLLVLGFDKVLAKMGVAGAVVGINESNHVEA